MGRRADGVVAAAWKGRLTRQRRSGLGVAEFCRREGVSPPSFYQWRRRLAPLRHAAERPQFVPIDVTLSRSAAGVEIELPGGAVVRLRADVSATLLTTAIHAAISGPQAGGIAAGEVEPC